MLNFISAIYKEGSYYLIEVPKEIGLAFKKSGYIPVKGNIQDFHFKSTLVNRKNEQFVLFVDEGILKEASVEEHDIIKASIELDPEPRDILIPEDVELILSENRVIYSTFLNMPSSERVKILNYILEIKKPALRVNRINEMKDYILTRVMESSY